MVIMKPRGVFVKEEPREKQEHNRNVEENV
jgi:hypothetical protein